MASFDSGTDVIRIAYLIVDFDDLNGDYKREYYEQMDSFLADIPLPELQLVFHNQWTPIHHRISMKNATVVNEGA